ncbi:MAG TPA: ParB N-terminal domain-containing protein [Fimbriimonadaceae bacterium]|nr:ParB N-terminal domain-containing protein [Fimbriimonadaceae bacterium]
MKKARQEQAYEVVPLDAVKPHPSNPRRGNIEAIKASMDAVGVYGAIVVQRSTGFILAGNHRWKAAQAAGHETIPVIFVDCDDERAKKIMLADNRIPDTSSYDDQALLDLLESLDGDLEGTGYDDFDVDDLLRQPKYGPSA